MVNAVPPSRDVLLRQLTDVLAHTRPDVPHAVGVALLDGEVELSIKPLDGHDIVDSLVGFHAPRSWHAFGIAAPATAHHVDGEAAPRQVTLTVLAMRDGTTANAMLDAGGNETFGDPSGDGRLLDACRRVLGLPTTPPSHAVAGWTVLHWLDAIVAAVLAADLGQPVDWRQVRALDRCRQFVDLPWSVVRGDVIAHRVTVPGIDPGAARWMDDGMFSREVMTAYPPLPELLDDLRALLPDRVYQRLLAVACARLEAHLPAAANG
jgi:hypothetical protein